MILKRISSSLHNGMSLKNGSLLKCFLVSNNYQSRRNIDIRSIDTKIGSEDEKEIAFHSSIADHWWNMKNPLHEFNNVRVPIIRNALYNNGVQRQTASKIDNLESVKILDVGCGGGVLSEALARLRANVVGIDPSKQLIDVAIKHQTLDPSIANNLRYERTTIYHHESKNTGKYDAVVISEVFEHIANKPKFLRSCVSTLRTGGCLIITTPNKTIWSKVFVIQLAEFFNVIPPGTHDYSKFISPENTKKLLSAENCLVRSVQGILFNPFTRKFGLVETPILMYAISAQKLIPDQIALQS